ncbi:hypothetical protein TPHA_0D04610 [Tetrapisispora phaffii CBS 4417]|uniref:NUA/TPR/MLP1-2-like domain-containing protein n=1 Tax=Tetrapisispora phaffii (strain ATCC 24235 / CBS 4417 / NBRC 1672 / NRRL Y-8282 / UCD 70-5) TaxID=1071381 RepID=G8BS21_TETPH|nr:hypothetical protein TPHA_0D04610 [Tetrapisispora phaffii CBS 4417]CCE63096.1 hypothetical protein TPHA_0D04610 [Tetrapisispora phaffii CBS 4417]
MNKQETTSSIVVNSEEWDALHNKLKDLKELNNGLKNEFLVLSNSLNLSNNNSNNSINKKQLDFSELEKRFEVINSINEQLKNELYTKNKEYFQIKQECDVKIEDYKSNLNELKHRLSKEILQNKNNKQKIINVYEHSINESLENDKKYVKDFEKLETLESKFLETYDQMNIMKNKIYFNTQPATPIAENEPSEESYDVEVDNNYNSWRTSIEYNEKLNIKKVVYKLQERLETVSTMNKELLKIIKLSENEEMNISLQNLNSNNNNLYNDTHSNNDFEFDINNIDDIKTELIKEKYEKSLLEKKFNDFLFDIESKLPYLQNNSVENETNNGNKIEEQKIIHEHDSLKLENQSLKIKLNDFESTVKTLLQQRSDLGHQINYLLITQSYLNEDNNKILTENELNFIRNLVAQPTNTWSTETQNIISERLLKFSNVSDLTAKNIKLISLVRELTNKMESIEKQNSQKFGDLEMDFKSIDEAKQRMIVLKEENVKNKDIINQIISEKKLLEDKIHGLNSTVTELNKSMEIKREPTLKNLELQKTNQSLLEKNNQLSIEISNASNENKILKEKFDLLIKSYTELKELKSEISTYTKSSVISKDGNETAKISELVDLKAKCKNLEKSFKDRESKFQELEIENNNVKDELKKVLSEYNTFKSTRGTIDSFNQNKNSIGINENTNKQLLKEELNTVKSLNKSLEAKIKLQENDIKILIEKYKSQIKWYQDKIDEMNTTMEVKISNLASSAESAAMLKNKNEIDELKKQIETKSKELTESLDRFARLKKQAKDKLNEFKGTENKLREDYCDLEKSKNELEQRLLLLESSEKSLQEEIVKMKDELMTSNNELDNNQRSQEELRNEYEKQNKLYKIKEEELESALNQLMLKENQNSALDLESLPDDVMLKLKEMVKKDIEIENDIILKAKLKEIEKNSAKDVNTDSIELSDDNISTMKEAWEKEYQHILKIRIEDAENQAMARTRKELEKEYEERLSKESEKLSDQYNNKLKDDLSEELLKIDKKYAMELETKLKNETDESKKEFQDALGTEQTKNKILSKKIEFLETQIKELKDEQTKHHSNPMKSDEKIPSTTNLSTNFAFGQNPFVSNASQNAYMSNVFLSGSPFSRNAPEKAFKHSTPDNTNSSITVQPTLTFNTDFSNESKDLKRSAESAAEDDEVEEGDNKIAKIQRDD